VKVVSQAPVLPISAGPPVIGATISAIGISPQDDNVRIIGLQTGNVFATINGSNTMTEITGPIPANYVTRIVIDPADKEVTYVALNGYGLPSGQQIWKTTNLVRALSAGHLPTWQPASNGIPDVSVDGLAVDPNRPSDLYAGTDLGVYFSDNGGASWSLYGKGLPKVEVYDVTIQKKFHLLRIATHGLGWWEAPTLSSPGGDLP